MTQKTLRPSRSSKTSSLLTATPLRLLALAAALALAQPTREAHGASQTWSNAPVDNLWNNANNWIGLGVPGGLNMTGNTVNNDTATFNSPTVSGIGGSGMPILIDDATSTSRARQIGSIVFDTADCGAYTFAATSPFSYPSNGVLFVSHNGSIRMNAAVTNSQTFLVPLYVRLPSSTEGVYNFVNDSTIPDATLYILGATNDSANTRGTRWQLGGSNTGTNTVGALSAGTTTSGVNGFVKQGSGTWILAGANDFRSQTAVRIVEGLLIVKDPGAFNGVTTGGVTVTNTGVLQIEGVTLNNSALNLHKGGTIRANGSASINGIAMGTHPGTAGTLATTSAADVIMVGTGIAGNSIVSGGAADTVLHTAGPGTIGFQMPNTYVGKWSFGAATNQIFNGSALGTGSDATVLAGAVLDLTPMGATFFTPTTSGFGGSGSGTAIGSTAAAVIADPSAFLDLTSKSLNLTYTPGSASGDLTRPALYIAQGTLSLNNTTFFVNNASGTPLGVGTYRLIQQASGSVWSSGSFAVIVTGSGLAANTTADIQVSGGNVNLVVTMYIPKNLAWKGGNPDATWDLNTTANFDNGGTFSVFNNSDTVTFGSLGASFPFVNVVGVLSPAAVVVDTSAADYHFSGSGQINGTASLTKSGSGTVTLHMPNSYTGGTVVSNGTLRVSAENAIPSIGSDDVEVYGSGVVDLNGYNNTVTGLSGNGAVDVLSGGFSTLSVGANDVSSTFAGALRNTAGILALTKIGTGQATLSGSNSYTGTTTVSLGTLAVANQHALGAGDLNMAGGKLDVQSARLHLNSLAGTGGSIVNDSTSSTNTLVVQGPGSTTFAGSIANGAGGGGIALEVLGGSLTMTAPNTYTGGTIVGSGATFNIHNSPAAVTGGVIASNGATLGLTGGSGTPGTPTSIALVDGATVTLTAGAEGKLWGNQWIGSANTTNRVTTTMSFAGTSSFQNFLGVVRFEGGGNVRFFNGGGVSGGENTTFEFAGSNRIHTRDPQTVVLGHIVGGSSATGIGGATGGGLDTYILGSKGLSSVFQGYIVGLNNIVKSGAGTLTLSGIGYYTNSVTLPDFSVVDYTVASNLIAYIGITTVSNGTLKVVAPNNLTNSPSITLAGGTLDATQIGYHTNQTTLDAFGAEQPTNTVIVTTGILDILSGQSLNGQGNVLGSVNAAAGSTIGVGLPVGTLAISGTASINGAVNMDLNRTNTPHNSDRITAASFSGSGATLTVVNAGPDLVNGDTFKLFSVPVSGFASVVLPATDSTGTNAYTWDNKLAVDGTIKLLSGGLSTINPNPTNMTASVTGGGTTLDVSWPASHIGWILQTNAIGLTATNAWFPVPGSEATNAVSLSIDKSKTNVFLRMVLP